MCESLCSSFCFTPVGARLPTKGPGSTQPSLPEALGIGEPSASPACLATAPGSQFSKSRPTVRTRDSLAGVSGASLQNWGILNQLLRQVWPDWLSKVHPPPGRSPTSC